MYKVKPSDQYTFIPSINYESALKNIMPKLKKHGDSYQVGWTISNNAKARSALLKKMSRDKIANYSKIQKINRKLNNSSKYNNLIKYVKSIYKDENLTDI